MMPRADRPMLQVRVARLRHGVVGDVITLSSIRIAVRIVDWASASRAQPPSTFFM
jgi:hypothetical protein